jgi:Ca-activated chloride channel family protein
MRCQVSGIRSQRGIGQLLWALPILCVLFSSCSHKSETVFLTPDQSGYRLFESEEYAAAAEQFGDPMWKGVALFRQGEFKKATGVFAGYDTADGAFNQGNALVMQGAYEEAAGRYRRALELRSGWESAVVNLEIARGRAKQVETKGGDMTGGEMGADDIVFDKGKPPPGAGEEQVEGGEPLSDIEMRASWLRRVQTRPADFLKSKFAYQHSRSANAEQAGSTP